MRSRSEILGIWAALKQRSKNKNDAMCVVLLCESKKFQQVVFLLSTLGSPLTEQSKVFRRNVLTVHR